MAENNVKDIEKEAKGTGEQEPNDGNPKDLPATKDDKKKFNLIEWCKEKKQQIDDWKAANPKIMAGVHRLEGAALMGGALYMAGKKTFDELKNNQTTDEDDAYLEKVDDEDDDNIIDMPEKK